MRRALKIVRQLVQGLFFLSLAGGASLASATDVRFFGSVGYSNLVNIVLLSADQVHNYATSGVSGQLRMELWATPSPFAGSFVGGYQTVAYPIGTLAAGASLNNISSGVLPFTSPPNGIYYVAMVLTEYTGGTTNGGYSPVNYLRFPDLMTGIGGPPPTDTTPPTVSIASPTAGNVSGTVMVSANASDNVGVTRVDFYVNGSLVASDSSAPYQYSWNTTSLANGVATLRATAFDAAGNSGQSSVVSVTVANGPPPDTTPPTISIASPTGGTVSGIITVMTDASDNVGVKRVDFYANGSLAASVSAAPWQTSWNSASVPNGAATLRAVAFDSAGNSGTSANVSIMVTNVGAPPWPPIDGVPPTAAIASPTGGSVSGMVAISVNASDNVGVMRVDLYANGSLVASDSAAPWQFSWNSATVPNGSAKLKAIAYDASGNAGTSAIVEVTVANAGAPPPPKGSTADAIEYYAPSLDHYFISAAPAEIAALDSGQIPGWFRTGSTIRVFVQAVPVASPVCRIYIPPQYGNSHFFSASEAECSEVIAKYPFFDYEAGDVFYIDTPDASGACPNGDAPVYRLWNNRADTNHRYTTSPSTRDEMVAKGYIAEGYGPDSVIMCSPP